MTSESSSRVLIPATRQALWGMPAVANFALGGLGTGFYLVAALDAGFRASRALTVASVLGPVLVFAGFAAVAVEAGRPLRGPRVLTRFRTSWMSRELWLGGAFAVCAAWDVLAPAAAPRAAALVTALGLALAQGFMVRHARGVIAWDVAVMPLVFLLSALVSGAGLAMLIEAASGQPLGAVFLGAMLILLALGALVWLAYVTWSADAAFLDATRPLREGRGAVLVFGGGYVLPFLLMTLGLAVPAWAAPAAAAAGTLMVAAQSLAKALVILTAGHLRPITLHRLRLERRPT